jgi:HD-like signal output (HDOD) protein
MLQWLQRLFAPSRRARTQPPARASASSPAPAAAPTDAVAADAPAPALPARKPVNPDGSASHELPASERALLERISTRIREQRYELPHLPSSSMAVIDLASQPSADVRELVERIRSDMVLSSELLRTANSAAYAASEPAETLHQAVVRIGMRSLRSLIFSISMRGVIFRARGLDDYAAELWRQAYSVASICRLLAGSARLDPEKAFLLGLLHDIGKVCLLDMLRRELQRPESRSASVSPVLLGRLFLQHHEHVGREMAVAWKLSPEIAAVAGCHHEYERNAEFPRSAALVSLAHKLDLFLALGDEEGYRGLARAREMDVLGLTQEQRAIALAGARSLAAAPPEHAAAA